MPRNSTATRRPRRPARPALQLESLEPRQLLTILGGNVFAQLTGATLRLTGDALPNQIVVASVTGGKMAVIGLPGTTVNGSADAFVTTKPVTNIVANLGAGDDAVGFSNSAQGLSVLSPSSFPSGAVGALQTVINGVAAGQQKFVLPGSLTLAAAAGGDVIGLIGDVGGSVVADLGPSSNDVGNGFGIGNATGVENPLLDSSVGGSISVVGGPQRDTLGLGRTTVAGSFAAALGSGSSYTGIAFSTIRGDLTVSGAGGDDAIEVLYSSVTGTVTAALGNGDNGASAGVTSFGAFAVTTGSGADDVELEAVRVRTNVTIATGAGDDLVGFNDVAITYDLTVNLGAGDDAIVLRTTQALAAWLYGGPGTNVLDIDGPSQTGIRRLYTSRLLTVA